MVENARDRLARQQRGSEIGRPVAKATAVDKKTL
jgi:hypothetical protein